MAGVVFEFDDVVVGDGLFVPDEVFVETDGAAGDVFGVEFFDPLGGGLGVEDSLEGFDHVDGEFIGVGGVVVVVGVGYAGVFEV